MLLNMDFVKRYSYIYNQIELTSAEIELFEAVSPRVRSQGFFEVSDFLAVCAWKSTRTKSLVRSNTPERVIEISRIALRCSEDLRIPILSLLRGVSTPTASALLTVWQPDSYTVIDFRVLNSLKCLRHDLVKQSQLAELGKSYSAYAKMMRAVSREIGCDLRSLDKALWMYDKVSANT